MKIESVRAFAEAMVKFLLIRFPNAVFIVNHSGGKDSQAMYLMLREFVPAGRLIVLHSHLPEVEWEGTEEFIKSTITHPLHVVQAGKTFFEMVLHRGMFPDPLRRNCTSDLKRGPIEKGIREVCLEGGFDTVINCMGMRAQESTGRAKLTDFKRSAKKSIRKRQWFEWLPIHSLSTAEVFQVIKDSDQEPFWVYKAGMTRKSCCFCIMASQQDLQTAKRLRPELFQKYVSVEKQIGRSMLMPTKNGESRYLLDVIN